MMNPTPTIDKEAQLRAAILADKQTIDTCEKNIRANYELMNHTKKELIKKYETLAGV